MTAISTTAPNQGDSPADESAPYRIAIVGGGPRALQVVDSIQQAWRTADRPRQIAITVFDPSPFPGAGAVYDPRQPAWLRMNYPSHRVSAWSDACIGDPSRTSFSEWAKASGRSSTITDEFAPRALVGEYLADCFGQLLENSPPTVSCGVKRLKVERVEPSRLSARVQTPDGDEHFDEAVITTGHGVSSRDHLEPSRFAGKTIAIRGFALTAIDTIFSLTEGVGGTFERSGDHWAYVRSGREPKAIVPFSRTGRPLYAKPCQSVARGWAGFEGWAKHARALTQLQSRHSGLDFAANILPILAEAADDFLVWTNPRLEGPGASEFLGCLHGSTPCCSDHDPLQVWRTSYAVATGRQSPNAPLALAEAWRVLYPQLVRLISHGGLAPASYKDWRRTAVAIERLAFGPPAESIGRLIALVEAGLMNLDYLRSPAVHPGQADTRLRGETEQLQVDELITAVIASPSTNARSGIIGRLLADGHISLSSDALGVKVDRCGRPLNASPEGQRRLRIFGRATEGWIVGNDTLNRELHCEISRWAAQLVEQISFEMHSQ